MDTISRLPRRLTQLYSDAKTAGDAVTDQDTADALPEVTALHRTYRIQKDRLLAWGLEWSDNTKGKQGDIDESVERAGLTETVTSVLGTIKAILDEAERMQYAALPAHAKMAEEKAGRPSDEAAWAASDRSRYENLARDLTTSIDILYDLSRSRRTLRDSAQGSGKFAPEAPKGTTPSNIYSSPDYSASDLTLINPATLPVYVPSPNTPVKSGLPPKLDPSDLILPQEEPPPYESVGVSSAIRVIGRLKTTHSSTNPWKTEGSKCIETPVLVEYATFDSAYRFTGVSPPLDRLHSLLSILVRLSNEQSFHGTLPCLGYFEDPKQPRFGLVFGLPSFVYSPSEPQKQLEELRPVTLLSVLQTGSKSLHNSNSATPPLEDRFRLAFTLARTFSKLHGEQFLHKDVNSSNILVFRKKRPQRPSGNRTALQFALRSPVICSFDLFSEFDIEPPHTMSSPNIYRHPQDPKFTVDKSDEYGPQFDLYGLGLILLEIGLWVPLSDMYKSKYSLAEFKQRVEDVYIRRLASKCGTSYMQVVRDCFWAAERIASGAESLSNISQLYNRILIRLQRCCLLDETDPSLEWSEVPSGAPSMSSSPSPFKRKPASTSQAADVPHNPSTYRTAKFWAMEKSAQILAEKAPQILERTRSQQSKPSSPDPSVSRSGSKKLRKKPSQESQHPVRKSISHTLSTITSPLKTQVIDWQAVQDPDPLEESGTLVDSSKATTPTFPEEKKPSITASSSRRSSKTPNLPRSMSFHDFTEKITLIQQHWRKRKEHRAAMQGRTITALVDSSTRQWPQATIGYPLREPEAPSVSHPVDCIESSIQIQTDLDALPRPKLRLHPVKFAPSIVNEWHNTMLPRLERLIERALKDSEETISIDLVAVGETRATARPTIFVTCTSTAKVKAILARRFRYDDSIYDLKVRRGKIRRSKMNRSSRRKNLPPHRSLMNTDAYSADMQVMNPFHQQRPLCGASIGAFRSEHLPPASYGGVILVDDEPLGMSVHHLLDPPSDDESESGDESDRPGPNDAIPSSANSNVNPWLAGIASQPGLQFDSSITAPAWDIEISDDEDDKPDDLDDESYQLTSESEFGSSDSDDRDEDTASISSHTTSGDIEGIPLGEGEYIKITQPALEDVEQDFFPNEEDKDEDHLDSHELGHVHASSGIRRWRRNNIVHEIDWALLKLNPERLQPYNLIQGGRKYCTNSGTELDQQLIRGKLKEPVCRRRYRPEEDEYPNQVASADSLGGQRVHCFGRTSGLQGGFVGDCMSAVKIYRRKTFSRSWFILGEFGMGGDSGAWVIQNTTHRVCGHVLAYSERNHFTYICPMEILLQDIKRVLGAKRIYLPGSVEEAQYLEFARLQASVDDSGVYDGRRMCEREKEEEEMAKAKANDLEEGLKRLGIVDSAVDMSSSIVDHGGSASSESVNGMTRRSVAMANSSRAAVSVDLSEIVVGASTLGGVAHRDKEKFNGKMVKTRGGLGKGRIRAPVEVGAIKGQNTPDRQVDIVLEFGHKRCRSRNSPGFWAMKETCPGRPIVDRE
ncbi:hypothetical protein GQ43DRAFT_481766 [Delitschia confertaspora ATCC 74209]|uniref:DUF7580 domain-containing protein n=1 Tax=Delitschia confertaspora ATCC 74209 TaxID=1513339 RepID=A0A9P4MRB6_9PLEO|nr:hypothetical protein GQ43DRAFT_481766 [Delitschia confertaspora ATCC 74209]